jgi:hypothetical protein
MSNFQQVGPPRRDVKPSQFQQASTIQRDAGQPRFNWQTTQLIWLLLGLLEALFGLRFLLQLVGASGAWASALYNFTAFFLLPFAGLTGANPAGSGLVLEISTLMAMAAYGLLGWLLARATWMIFYRPYANIGVMAASIIEQPRP